MSIWLCFQTQRLLILLLVFQRSYKATVSPHLSNEILIITQVFHVSSSWISQVILLFDVCLYFEIKDAGIMGNAYQIDSIFFIDMNFSFSNYPSLDTLGIILGVAERHNCADVFHSSTFLPLVCRI